MSKYLPFSSSAIPAGHKDLIHDVAYDWWVNYLCESAKVLSEILEIKNATDNIFTQNLNK